MSALAWTTNGRVRLATEDGVVTDWDSAFARQVVQTAQSVQRKGAWRHQRRDDMFSPWNTQPEDVAPTAMPCSVVALSAGRVPGELLYALGTPTVSAVLVRVPADPAAELEPAELRLFHTNDFAVHDLCAGGPNGAVALSVASGPARHLAWMDRAGGRVRDLTEGDVVDAAPRWMPGQPDVLVYQSAGLGRDAAGHLAGREAFGVWRLDTRTGQTEPMWVEAGHDLLCPEVAADGSLWCVRRPYASEAPAVPWHRTLRDVLLLPIRLARAVFGWLDLFATSYGGESLLTSGGPRRAGPDTQARVVLGHVVDVARARAEAAAAGEEVPGMVPQDWVLVRRRPDGVTEEVARGVLAFDLLPEGGVVWTNGAAVWRRSGEGPAVRLATDEHIEHVVAW